MFLQTGRLIWTVFWQRMISFLYSSTFNVLFKYEKFIDTNDCLLEFYRNKNLGDIRQLFRCLQLYRKSYPVQNIIE